MVSANLKDWNEVTKGLYRYVIGANAAYEIHIMYWNHKTDILLARAILYIVGDWNTKDGAITERESLLTNAPVIACLGKAVEDYKENNSQR